MNEFVASALAVGFTRAVWLESLAVECEARLREGCNPQKCPNYGHNWVCPPGCGSLEECAERAKQFSRGLLLQSVSETDRSSKDYKRYQELSRAHNFRLREFIERHCLGRDNILTLTSGGCALCHNCAYPAPCHKPDVRMNSLSAYGIDVGKLCALAKLEFSFRPDLVCYVALVLMKEGVG